MSVSYANRPEPAAVPELLGSARFLAAASAATWVPRRKVHDRLLSTGRRKRMGSTPPTMVMAVRPSEPAPSVETIMTASPF